MIIESRFIRVEIVTKNALNLAGNDKLRLEVQFCQQLVNLKADFGQVIFGVESKACLCQGRHTLEVGIMNDLMLEPQDSFS